MSTIPQPLTFQNLEPLPHLPNPTTALKVLQQLSGDPTIKHIMLINQLLVKLLAKLALHECLLGQNVNAGQAIKLKLRTDKNDGFRSYKDIHCALCHKLTHNIWENHDNNVCSVQLVCPCLLL